MTDTNFRREPIRSRKLLDSAKGQPCTLCVPGVCNRDPATTVSCHVHDESFGMGVKADDQSTFHGCYACHVFWDTGAWIGVIPEAEMLRMIVRALLRTLRNRIERGFVRIDEDKPSAPKAPKSRKPKELRTPVPSGRPLQSSSDWPKGRKLEGRNELRRNPKD